jgi:RAB6A-GEF complex partner protein 1
VLLLRLEKLTNFQIRVYSREADLDTAMDAQSISAPIVHLTPSGQDSLLVYTYENLLLHYVINVSNATVRLVQVGQIALHGIIRAPPRVRALSWILPEDQLGVYRRNVPRIC